MAPPRLLLCGDVLGHLNQLFKRVSSVNKSTGPFDALLCVGQFFPDSSDHLGEFMDYIEGRSEIPLPTYFIGDYGASAMKVLSAATKDPANLGFKMDGLRVCENLYWLKGSGKFTLHGLSVSYLSGRHSTSSQQFGTYSQDDIDALRAFAEEPGIVDLFLTNEWPSGVTTGAVTSDLPLGIFDSYGSSSAISELVTEIKPRYHVAGTKGVFYAREPYANTEAVHVTRFLGLGAVGNKDRQKFLHAISPTPASTMSASEIGMKPTNTTLCPFTSVDKAAHTDGAAKRPIDKAPESQYWRYDVSQKRQRHGDTEGNRLCFKFLSTGSCARGEKCHFQHDGDAREQCSRGVCFDFLNKGKCERGPDCNFKHSLQDEDKSFPNRRRGSGNTNTNTDRSSDCWFCLSSFSLESHLITSIGEHYYCALAKGPLVEDHVLIIPIEHTPTTLSSSSECEPELIRFQNSLKKYFKNQEKEVVFFEWFSTRGTHANLQVIPIPSSRASVVKDIFNLAAQKLGFKFTEIKKGRKSLQMKFDRKCSLFYVELPGDTILYHSVEENETFPAQFGREVLAGLLNMADRADWKNCKLGKEEETKMAENFKNRYQEYNPNP
ncbi:Zinc finger CCCH domain-containing protein [Actinidia chinensis var. chinensis]|uniref:Zinc finger CCCH domain-containing protein n=1 Tax=Actinidia chinensis var. chinensis TaxID=1590841 RepID=A0A2R6QUU6_ACTCC|nr:Zinc finger CCCH domain-containing protein [Actinidia chinensis var. chinensis]